MEPRHRSLRSTNRESVSAVNHDVSPHSYIIKLLNIRQMDDEQVHEWPVGMFHK